MSSRIVNFKGRDGAVSAVPALKFSYIAAGIEPQVLCYVWETGLIKRRQPVAVCLDQVIHKPNDIVNR